MLVRLAGVEDHSQVGVTVPCDLCRNSGHGSSCPFALLAESCAPLRPSSLSKVLSYGVRVHGRDGAWLCGYAPNRTGRGESWENKVELFLWHDWHACEFKTLFFLDGAAVNVVCTHTCISVVFRGYFMCFPLFPTTSQPVGVFSLAVRADHVYSANTSFLGRLCRKCFAPSGGLQLGASQWPS